MAGGLVCWRCGGSLKNMPRRLPRLAKCKNCDADLHVCRLCRHYDPMAAGRCQHEMAEPAREVDVANFCQYFKPQPGAYSAEEAEEAQAAKARLEALFAGDGDGSIDDTAQRQTRDEAEQRAKLEALFGGGESDERN